MPWESNNRSEIENSVCSVEKQTVIFKVCEVIVVLVGTMTERSPQNSCIWNGIALEQNPMHSLVFAT